MNINKNFLEIKDITIVFKNNKGKWQMFTDYAFNLTFIEHLIHAWNDQHAGFKQLSQ